MLRTDQYGFTEVDHFASRMVGQILIPTAGSYTFGTTSDDGSVLYLDGALIVNNDFLQGATLRSGVTTLTAGLHAIDIGYFDQDSGNALTISWNVPGSAGMAILPNSALNPIPEAAISALSSGLLLGACALGRRWPGPRCREGIAKSTGERNDRPATPST